MIPFDKFFAFLFRSFKIDNESQFLMKLSGEGYSQAVIIKRSWVFALLLFWAPLCITILLSVSIFLSYFGLEGTLLTYFCTLSIIFSLLIFLYTNIFYLYRFRRLHQNVEITYDFAEVIGAQKITDYHFIKFFNWSFLLQLVLFISFSEAIFLVISSQSIISLLYVSLECIFLFISFFLAGFYRKKIIDLEMDFNIAIPGKIFFINQSGFLSQMQTIDSDKIKSIQSVYPNKIAAFFNFGTIHILTEGDDRTAMGTMSMYYVKNPEITVDILQKILNKK